MHIWIFCVVTRTRADFECSETNLIVENVISPPELGCVRKNMFAFRVWQFLQPPTGSHMLVTEPPVYDVGEIIEIVEKLPILITDQ